MFDPSAIKAFRFLPFEFDETSGRVQFHYAFDEEVFFTEELLLPIPESGVSPESLEAVRRTLFLLSLVAGISYYKAAVPQRAIIESGAVTESELEYLRSLYFHGLGEFSYVNQLDLKVPTFEAEVISQREPLSVEVLDRSLVAVGGGKDSCVSIDIASNSTSEVLLASINKAKPIVDVINKSGLPSVHAQRTLSTELFRINEEGAYNGHVPITAVVSLALTAMAILHRCSAVVMSNERSASVGNTEYQGTEVNHQYSKSFEAEELLSELIKTSVTPDVEYFSLLRPFSELEISRRFAGLEMFHDVFTSCNRAFRIDESRRSDRWCADCPKCRFVFLAMAPFVVPEQLTQIFGSNLLNDPAQAEGFDELIGYSAFKPFECVGEVEESVAAFMLLMDQPHWTDSFLVTRFVSDILPKLDIPDDVVARPFFQSSAHRIPHRFQRFLSEVK